MSRWRRRWRHKESWAFWRLFFNFLIVWLGFFLNFLQICFYLLLNFRDWLWSLLADILRAYLSFRLNHWLFRWGRRSDVHDGRLRNFLLRFWYFDWGWENFDWSWSDFSNRDGLLLFLSFNRKDGDFNELLVGGSIECLHILVAAD